MRMLHSINLETVGGVEISFAQFLRGTADTEMSHQVLVQEQVHPFFAPVLSESKVQPLARSHLKRWHGVRLPRAAVRLRARNAARVLGSGRPDLLIGWNTFANTELPALARVLKCPLVYYEHGNGWRGGRRRERTAGAFLSATRGVVCNSHAAVRVLQLLWGYSGRPAVVYCAIGDGFEMANPLRSLPSDRRLRIGVAGRLAPMKGMGLALFMLRTLCQDDALDAELHIAGVGPQEDELRGLAKLLGLEDRTVFHGLVQDMRTFYDHMDVQVVPSIHEPFGRVSIEAQARGCPVVVAGVDGLPETLIADQSGIVVPVVHPLHTWSELGSDGNDLPALVYDPAADALTQPKLADPADLAQAVHRIVGDSEEYCRFSEAARSQALERFSPREFVLRLHSALVNLAGAS